GGTGGPCGGVGCPPRPAAGRRWRRRPAADRRCSAARWWARGSLPPAPLVGVDRAQRVEAVGGEAEVRADLLGGPRIRFVDDRVDPGALQRHRGHRTGDAAPDDQGLTHDALLAFGSYFVCTNKVYGTLQPMASPNDRTKDPAGQRRRAELLDRLMTAGRAQSAATGLCHSTVAALQGLSATEEKALDLLDRFGPMTAGELAERSGLAPPSVTGLINR